MVEFLGYQKYGECSDCYRLFCFLTDSVFDACFDETINFYQWIKPWKSYITVDKMQKQNMNWFSTVLRVVICFIILTDLAEFSVEVLCG